MKIFTNILKSIIGVIFAIIGSVVGDRADNNGTLVTGSSRVFIDGKPVSRVGDKLNYDGEVLDGDPIVKIE